MSVFFEDKNNFIKFIFSVVLALPISYLNFNQLNFHGDYNYFKIVYNDLNLTFIPEQLSILETTFGGTLDPLLIIIFLIAEYFLSYELFMLTINILLFFVYLSFIYEKKDNLLFFLLIISSYYIFAIAAASPKNIIALIFFILSLKNFDNKKFYLYYYCAFFTHSAASIAFFLISIILLKKDFYKILFDTKKLTILLIPILLSFLSTYDKIYGYNILIQDKNLNNFVLDKKETKETEDESSKVKVKESSLVDTLILKYEKTKNFLNKKYIFNPVKIPMSLRSIYKIKKDIEYSQKVGEVVKNSNKKFNLSVSFSIIDFIKLSMISILILALNRNYNVYFCLFLIFVLVGLGFPRVYMLVNLLVIYLILKSNINLKRLSFYSLIFFSYIFYFFIKNILFIITFYNTGYIYL